MTQRRRRITTIGSFDGIHCGHRLVVDMLLSTAQERGLTPSVFAFAQHPLEIIDPSRTPPKLMTFERQQATFKALGLEVFPIYFTAEMRRMTSSEYMRMLHADYDVDVLVIGFDNRFGSDRESTIDDYLKAAAEIGIEVIQAPQMPDISSTIIRNLISNGDIEQANHKLGYHYPLTGIVEHGKELGHTIGFPTANLRPDDDRKLVPANGVYAAIAILPDGSRHGAMVNIGHRPTIRDGRTYRSIEANIFDFDGNLYDRTITLEFVAFMRHEIRLNSIEELRQRLIDDHTQAVEILSRLPQD